MERDKGRKGELIYNKGRAFASGMFCLCCMDGNCHVVGHVIDDCQCCCLERKSAGLMGDNHLGWALSFKRSYVESERKFRERQIKKPKSKSLESSSTASEYPCRQFINDGRSRCRVEYGNYRRRECGSCFQREQKWTKGEMFTGETEQLCMVREFYQHVVQPTVSSSSISLDQQVMQEVMALQKGRRRKNVLHGRIPQLMPSGTILFPEPEERWFGRQDEFPTHRRVQRRLWNPSLVVGEMQESWVEKSGI